MAKKKDEIEGGTTDEETNQTAEVETNPEDLTDAEVDKLAPEIQAELNRLINGEKARLGVTLQKTLEAHGILQRNYDTQGKRLSELEKTLQDQRQRERERELKSAEGTDLVDSIKLKHQAEDEWDKVTKARSELDRERTEHQTAIDKALKNEATEKANELAKESGVTADLLLLIGSDTAENGRVTYNLKRMEAIAKSVPKGEGEEVEEEVAEAEVETPAVRGQRSRAAGAGTRSATRGLSTMQDYDEAYNRGEISTEEYSKARVRFGVAY
jgi:hypothetical protein